MKHFQILALSSLFVFSCAMNAPTASALNVVAIREVIVDRKNLIVSAFSLSLKLCVIASNTLDACFAKSFFVLSANFVPL